jgi:Arc/MetJ family transcription regulator
MADYQLAHLDLSTRIELVSVLLDPSRRWGLVTELAQKHRVSRKFLYELRDTAQTYLQEALLPHPAGRKAARNQVEIDDDFVQRTILALLSIVPGTVRTIQLFLDLVLGSPRSVGFISQSAKKLGAAALEYTQALRFPILVLAEADEIFQGRHPCLTLVDQRSFLALSLSAQTHRDETAWGSLLLDVQQQGVHLVDVASDGGRGIQAGVKAVSEQIPLRPDLFHLLREAYRVTQRLEKRAYRAIEAAERARRAHQEQEMPKRRRGAPIKGKLELSQAEAEEQEAIAQLDAWEWLSHEIRLALEPITPQGLIASSQAARQTLETAIALLKTLENATIQGFTEPLSEKLDELIAPLEWLQQALAAWREGVPAELEAYIVWAWKHQKELNLTIEQVLRSSQQDLVSAYWNALSLFHRSSSLAESFHSWLRPYLQVHRGMPAWLLPLMQLLWNHHVFQRGKRQGQSPMELAGLGDLPSLSELFDGLSRSEMFSDGVGQFFKVQEKCYPISIGL